MIFSRPITHPAKNVCLAGVKSVTIHDPELTTRVDLGTQVRLVFLLYMTHDVQ